TYRRYRGSQTTRSPNPQPEVDRPRRTRPSRASQTRQLLRGSLGRKEKLKSAACARARAAGAERCGGPAWWKWSPATPMNSRNPRTGGVCKDRKRRRKRREETTRRKEVQAAEARARSAASSRRRNMSSSSSSG
ncbi:hypothetical protein PVAP13_6KG246518, partial [Panicum virgatum]